MDIVEIKNLKKTFGNIVAVNNLSFTIPKNSIFAIIGRNGAGKTTTLRIMLDIYQPDNGEITYHFNDKTITSKSTELPKYISYLPEERGLYKKMTVWDTLIFFAELRNVISKKTQKMIENYLEIFDLKDRKNAKIQDLSKGNQQKIQFIATIITNPEIIILDEPLSGLDPININIIKDIIYEQKQAGKTIVYSTHLIDFAEKISDSILFIDEGKNILSGNIEDVKANFAKSNVILSTESNIEEIDLNNFIENIASFGKSKSIKLKENIKPQDFLKYLVENNIIVNEFRANDISLQHIYFSYVQKEIQEV
ncbi:MAG TPA: ATP-binding cassette domain-containing protein [Ignavibacteriales bacterium]|jgi:ABC-2 type transport system ATP-binding protein|nr:ATP-binding cassette domain-containing protein [Ignavibacteriales bacterium]